MAKLNLKSSEFNAVVGAVLRARRTKAGFEQSHVAKAVGARVEQIARYEAGTNTVSVLRLCQLAHVFGVSAATLMLEIETQTSGQLSSQWVDNQPSTGNGID